MEIRIATFINISDFQFRAGESGASFVSWFLSEFIVLKVEIIEDRNLVLALLRKIPGSDGKNIDFRFNYTPVCIFLIFWGGLTQRLHRLLPPLNLWLRLRFGFRPQFSGACAIDRFGFRPQFTPSNMFINPSPNRRGLFPNPNFLSSPTLDPKSRSKST